ncbi:MAG TPA: enoyl-CoA hydratase-related protein [Niabella sp.]|nr:enoyl-CoA hydratase-related protein [Niabella sp.]HOZ96121.1 enoyl-CoA hydratase-related protein [Niabella sp.]HQW13487.1 enoyl-CoA hydratase-related protein [Niabella sp.]HQX18881.1 enoyl-CoA hydratase-related protein [Niabella sp.]HQX41541.1 enoyl-CoA hydratase-related protein [Niabella sp.]
MQYSTILFEVNDNICVITINRPDKLNALNKTVFDELDHAIDAVIHRQEIKSAIITGSGEKAFVAGADIAEFADLSAESGALLSRRGQKVFDKIESCPKIILAAVNGFALGGGCELAMACHFRIAAENAKFGQPEVNLGLLPGYGGTQRLTQLIGKGRAIELLATGSMIDGLTAFNYGLVNHLVRSEELLPKAKSILSVINSKAPLAVAACIDVVQYAYDIKKEGYLQEAKLFGTLLQTSDSKEGVAAFLEKRKANFKGE